jgi:hypothetical protein
MEEAAHFTGTRKEKREKRGWGSNIPYKSIPTMIYFLPVGCTIYQ